MTSYDIHDLVDLDGFGGCWRKWQFDFWDQTQRHQGKGIEVRAWTLGSEGREGSGRRQGRCRPSELQFLVIPRRAQGQPLRLLRMLVWHWVRQAHACGALCAAGAEFSYSSNSFWGMYYYILIILDIEQFNLFNIIFWWFENGDIPDIPQLVIFPEISALLAPWLSHAPWIHRSITRTSSPWWCRSRRELSSP